MWTPPTHSSQHTYTSQSYMPNEEWIRLSPMQSSPLVRNSNWSRRGRRTDLRLSKHSGWRGTANFIYLMNTNKGVPMVCEYHRHTPRTLVTHSNQGTHARDYQQTCKRAAVMSRVREKPASCGSFVSQRLVMDKACAQRAEALG